MIDNNIILDPNPIDPANSIFLHKGWACDTRKLYWLEIPKNASKSVSALFLRNKLWREAKMSSPDVCNYTKIVILRDPIERWKKSVLELAHHVYEHNKNFDVDAWLQYKDFVNNLHDIHLWPQTRYLHNLNVNECAFVLLNQNMQSSLEQILDYPIKLQKKNATADNTTKQQYKSSVYALLNNNSNLNTLRQHYASDYELLEYLQKNNKIYT